MRMTSKKEIFEYVQTITRSFCIERISSHATISISNALSMSRSLTSQHLNEYVKENKLIKISSRPVYYLDKHALEQTYQMELKQKEYVSVSELMEELNQNSPNLKDFQKAIGCDGSLSYCISQIKSALLYPQGGLPILLFGAKGSGKTFLTSLIHEFCLHQIPKQKNRKLLRKRVFKAEDGKKQMEDIFGSYDGRTGVIKKGLMEEAEGGILCIQDAWNLKEECQEKLAEYIGTGKFTRINDEKGRIECSVRLILCTTKNPHEYLANSLVLHIPVICHIPSLIDRNDDERLEFIIKLLKEEQQRLRRIIFISEKLLQFMMEYHFEDNINELKKSVTSMCANAFVECTSSESMNVYLYHLPEYMLDHLIIDKLTKEDTIVRVDNVEKKSKSNNILGMWEKLLIAFQDCYEARIPFTKFLENGQKALRHYYDILVFQENYYDARLKAMEKIVINVLHTVKTLKSINLPINCGFVLARMIISSQRNNSVLKQWEHDHRILIQECLSQMKTHMPNAYILTDMIMKQMQANMNIQLNEMNMMFLMLNINFYNHDVRSQDTIGIILSHGYSTASSIADAANSLLSSFIFEAIDMPLDTSVQEICKKLNDFIEGNRHLKNIILLVDMGSLEDIGKVIANSVNVGVINNISTSLALNVGMKIIAHVDLQQLLEDACKESQCKYKMLSVAQKEKAIVFTNDAGFVVSEKLCQLFKDSLPKNIDLKLIEYDYEELKKNKIEDILFKKYDVVLMVKPYTLTLKKVNCVSLEEIMNFQEIDIVNKVLMPYLDATEIEHFDQQLLKNFSLHSVMENSTILNAEKLLDYVSDAIHTLQHTMQKKFQSKTIVGMYIHICFLVERLVTKTSLDKYEDLSGFIEMNQAFITEVNTSFEAMLSHYNVQLPISEIAYLYEYIANDKEKGSGEDEF